MLNESTMSIKIAEAAAAVSAGEVLDQPAGAAGLRAVQAVHRRTQNVIRSGGCLLAVDIF